MCLCVDVGAYSGASEAAFFRLGCFSGARSARSTGRFQSGHRGRPPLVACLSSTLKVDRVLDDNLHRSLLSMCLLELFASFYYNPVNFLCRSTHGLRFSVSGCAERGREGAKGAGKARKGAAEGAGKARKGAAERAGKSREGRQQPAKQTGKYLYHIFGAVDAKDQAASSIVCAQVFGYFSSDCLAGKHARVAGDVCALRRAQAVAVARLVAKTPPP